MSKLIAMFNHKGGVSKTTTTFNLGWALAERGSRVLIVDTDPQCNLTGMSLSFSGADDFEEFYKENPNANLHAAVNPAFTAATEKLKAADVVPTKHKNLFLLAGHLDLGTFESELSMAHKLGSAMPVLQNLPGAIGYVVRETAKKNKINVVLIDMSPSIGALNQNVFLHSDYFIIPTSPDYFCRLAISSLAKTLPRWVNQAVSLRQLQRSLAYKIPEENPKFIGMISQRYRPMNQKPSTEFMKWIDKIIKDVEVVLLPALADADMLLDKKLIKRIIPVSPHVEIARISDFNGLIAKSQELATAVFALSDRQLNAKGVVLENLVESRNSFKDAFSKFADRVSALI
jgi:cellulose biosynthesis protein BcsQ